MRLSRFPSLPSSLSAAEAALDGAGRRRLLGWGAATLAGGALGLPHTLLAANPPGTTALPHSADLRYDVVWGPVSLEVVQGWRVDAANRYALNTEFKLPLAFSNRLYVSKGVLGDNGLVPDRYEDLEAGDPTPRRVAVFDRGEGQLRYGRPDKLKSSKLEANAQDMNGLSFQLAFLGLQAVGKTLPVTNGKGVVQHSFKQIPGGPVQLNGQSVETQRLKSVGADGEIEVWLAPSLGNLPVSIVRGQDGRSIRFVATSIKFKA